MRRIVPQEDCLIKNSGKLDNNYKDGVYCRRCGNIILFRNRGTLEPVKIICPICKNQIFYG